MNGCAVNGEILEADNKEDVGEWMGCACLGPELVEVGRTEEVELMVKKLDMFEFGDLDGARRRGGKEPTTTKWVEGWKIGDDGERLVRCRLVGRDFKVRRPGASDVLLHPRRRSRRKRCCP